MKIKDTMVFDLDTLMKVRKIINLSHLSIESGVPKSTLEGIYWNEIKSIPDGQIEKLCKYFNCSFVDLLSDYTASRLEERRKFFERRSFFKNDGVIYFIKSNEGKMKGLTKIGFTSDLLTRISTLSNEQKSKLELLYYIPSNDVVNLEKLLHRIFSHKKVKGEWFALDDSDIRMFSEERKPDAANIKAQ